MSKCSFSSFRHGHPCVARRSTSSMVKRCYQLPSWPDPRPARTWPDLVVLVSLTVKYAVEEVLVHLLPGVVSSGCGGSHCGQLQHRRPKLLNPRLLMLLYSCLVSVVMPRTSLPTSWDLTSNGVRPERKEFAATHRSPCIPMKRLI